MTRNIAYGVTAALTVAVFLAQCLGAPSFLVFTISTVSLVGLVWVFGRANDVFGRSFEPRTGWVIRANLDTAAKLISPIVALSAGLTTVVKASIIGTIVGSLLLVLGTSLLLGGLKNGLQSFSATAAGVYAPMLTIVAAVLILPTISYNTTPSAASPTITLSIGVAVVMFMLYVLYFTFFYSAPYLLAGRPWNGARQPRSLGRPASFLLLAMITVVTGFVADIFVSTIPEVGISEAFVGFVLIPLVGSMAEHIVCLRDAYRNNVHSSVNDSLDSSLRVALVLTPALTISGTLLGNSLRLVFDPLELGSLLVSVIVVSLVTLDGRSHWLEGAMLCGVYAIVALAFSFA